MQKVLFYICSSFLFFSLPAQQPVEQLVDIELEISALKKQLDVLQKRVDTDYRYEMKEELSGQNNMRTYEWSSFSHHLESAEAYEENARGDEKMIEAIKARLQHLSLQVEKLLSK